MTVASSEKIALEPRAVLPMSIDAALDVTTAALKNEGFGVLTKIDVQSTLKEKLGESFDPYLILGACNPALAHRALTLNSDIGLLLPCNVTLHETRGETTVSIIDPNAMLAAAGGDESVTEIAREASDRLKRVAEALASR
jgi:uncharacterized protein (DUF302 family)